MADSITQTQIKNQDHVDYAQKLELGNLKFQPDLDSLEPT